MLLQDYRPVPLVSGPCCVPTHVSLRAAMVVDLFPAIEVLALSPLPATNTNSSG